MHGSGSQSDESHSSVRRTRGDETRVAVMLIFPVVMGGNWVGYLIAIVASTTFHRATKAMVHSEYKLGNPAKLATDDIPAD